MPAPGSAMRHRRCSANTTRRFGPGSTALAAPARWISYHAFADADISVALPAGDRTSPEGWRWIRAVRGGLSLTARTVRVPQSTTSICGWPDAVSSFARVETVRVDDFPA